MIIFGVDPGTARVGWAVVQTQGSITSAIAFGCITTNQTEKEEKRLQYVYDEIFSLLPKYAPDWVSVEQLYFASNAKTVIPVGQARGVVLLAAAHRGVPVVSYSPLAVKRAVCGDGQADKTQVQRMVMRLLHLTSAPKLDDTVDALAIALTHAYSYKWKEKIV